MNKLLCVALATFLCAPLVGAQSTRFRVGVFLHHSTGERIWGPNGSATSIPQEVAKYNTLHGLTGTDAVVMAEAGWPTDPWSNEWERWHRIFNNAEAGADIRPYLSGSRIVMVKSCFPSSSIVRTGTAADTLSPETKTIHNYKWHWRSIIRVMAGHPNNFFVIWTNAPLVAGATNTQEALLSDRFCRWAADTLAKGLDPGFGAFPRNVHVFDFFHVLAAANGMLPAQYASSTSDSHPNSAATALVAPRLVNELFDAALAYVQSSASAPGFEQLLERFSLEQNFPNPFNPSTRIAFSLPARSEVDLSVYDLLGNPLVTLANGVMSSGRHEVVMDGTGLATGVYFYRIRTAAGAIVRRCVLIR